MADILNIPGLGKLEIVEVYTYYDQPVLFSCKNAAGHLYLVLAADENDQYETWFYAAVSVERLNHIRSGAIDLHDAFADSEDGFLLQVMVPYDDQTPFRPEPIQSNRISEEMLPIPGERLNLKTVFRTREAIEIPQKRREEAPKFTITGTLTGAFLRSKRFEIETIEKTYTGDIADEAIETVKNATLSREYTATIQEITQRSEATDEITKPKYQLLSLG